MNGFKLKIDETPPKIKLDVEQLPEDKIKISIISNEELMDYFDEIYMEKHQEKQDIDFIKEDNIVYCIVDKYYLCHCEIYLYAKCKDMSGNYSNLLQKTINMSDKSKMFIAEIISINRPLKCETILLVKGRGDVFDYDCIKVEDK